MSRYAIARPANLGDTVRTPTNALGVVVNIQGQGDYSVVTVEQSGAGLGCGPLRYQWSRRQLINFGSEAR